MNRITNAGLLLTLLLFYLLTERVDCYCNKPLVNPSKISASSELSKDRGAEHAVLYGKFNVITCTSCGFVRLRENTTNQNVNTTSSRTIH